MFSLLACLFVWELSSVHKLAEKANLVAGLLGWAGLSCVCLPANPPARPSVCAAPCPMLRPPPSLALLLQVAELGDDHSDFYLCTLSK